MYFNKQGHWHRFEDEEERLNIHWDMVLSCQYECSYCYARNIDYYQCNWEDGDPPLELQISVIDAVSKSTLPYNFGLLGGEPTMNKHFKVLLAHIWRKCTNGKNRIYIVSNGAKSLDFFDSIPCYDGISFLWSFHPEYTPIHPFLEKVKLMKKKGYGTKVNLLLHPGSRYWTAIEVMYDKLKEEDIEVHPQFIYKEDDKHLWPYSDNFWRWTHGMFGNEPRNYRFGHDDLFFAYNDYEVFSGRVNQFKGWKCYNSNYEININGYVKRFCDKEDHGTLLSHDRNFFKNIKRLEPMICEYDNCCCDGLLKILKVKE